MSQMYIVLYFYGFRSSHFENMFMLDTYFELTHASLSCVQIILKWPQKQTEVSEH